MTLQDVRNSAFGNVVLIAVSLSLATFLLTVGVAELLHPHVPDKHLALNTAVCLALSGLGLAALWVAISNVRGLLLRRRRADRPNRK
mgnify:CR=1 FL=1